ncbi:MAG: hypothetical protein ABI723_13705 [Bacteroidia bacterium]
MDNILFYQGKKNKVNTAIQQERQFIPFRVKYYFQLIKKIRTGFSTGINLLNVCRDCFSFSKKRLIENTFAFCLLPLAFCLLFLTSCQYFKKEDKGPDVADRVARVYDTYLYKADLTGIVPKGTSNSDSVMIVKNYIDNWIKQNVILHKAESNLNNDEKDVEDQLQQYRNSLITFIYQRELIKEKLDTVVNDAEMEEYYNQNQSNFQLRDNIVKFLFVKVNANAPKIKKLRDWYRSSSAADRRLLEDYCHQFAVDFFLNDDEWIPFDQCVNKTGIKTYNQEEYLQNNRTIEIADSANITFVCIKDFKIKESLSPLSFETDNIRNLIINKRKLELIHEMEKAAYQQALVNKDFEIYKK